MTTEVFLWIVIVCIISLLIALFTLLDDYYDFGVAEFVQNRIEKLENFFQKDIDK